MTFYVLEPEVAGGFGENTVMLPNQRPPRVVRFHYKFDGWLGDELLETVACFIVSKSVAQAIRETQPTGVEFDEVEVSKSEQFDALYPNRRLPEFVWLKITGTAGRDDFGLSKQHRLVVSQRSLDAVRSRPLRQCAISPYDGI